jgi:hypothetical protein
MAKELKKIMKKTASNMKKIGSSKFASGMFFYLEEKIPSKDGIRRVFYVSAPVKKKHGDDPAVPGIASVSSANKMLQKIMKKMVDFDKGSALCSGYLNKSIDQETLLLKITVSKGCSESKLQKGLKLLDKEYSGNKVTNFIHYSADFHAKDALVVSEESSETLDSRKVVKAFTKSMKGDSDLEKMNKYEEKIEEFLAEINENIQKSEVVATLENSFTNNEFLDMRDCLEESEIYLRKYEKLAKTLKKKSKFPTLYDQVTTAQEAIMQRMSDLSELSANDTIKGKSKMEKALDMAQHIPGVGVAVKAGRSAKKKKKKEAASQAVDAGLKTTDNVYKGKKEMAHRGDDEAQEQSAQEVLSGIGIVQGVKKTVESAERIERAKRAKKQLRADYKDSKAQIAKLNLVKPSQETMREEYKEWRVKKKAIVEEQAAMDHLIEIQNSIQQKGGFDMLDGVLGTASNALRLSVVGEGVGDILKGVRYGVKAGKKAGDEMTKKSRNSKRKKRNAILGKQVGKKLMENARRGSITGKSEDESLLTEDRVENTVLNLTPKEQKTYDEMKQIREIRQKSREGNKLTRSERKKLALTSNEDASKEYQIMRSIDTAKTIIEANEETRSKMLKVIGIQPEEWEQINDQAKLQYNEWRGADPDEALTDDDQKNLDIMLSDILCLAIPKI